MLENRANAVVRKAAVGRTVTLKVTGNSDDPYTLIIEPYGLT